MNGSLLIFAQHEGQPAKNRPWSVASGSRLNAAPLALTTNAQHSYLIRPSPISRFVFRDKRFAKLIECSLFYFSARLIHQIQIKMQVMQCDQAKPENFFRLDEMPDVTARKLMTGIAARSFLRSDSCPE